MTAVILSFTLSVLLAGTVWLAAGARFQLNPDSEQNDLLNLGSYFLIALPFVFAFVFFVVEEL